MTTVSGDISRKISLSIAWILSLQESIKEFYIKQGTISYERVLTNTR